MTTPEIPDPEKRRSPEGSRRSTRVSATIGVEIGYNTIYMVRLLQATDGTISFDGCRTVAFDPVMELESSAFATVLKGALKEFCGTSREAVIWAAPKQDRARLYHVQIPRVNASRISGAVYWALKREEPFLDKETVVDFELEEDGAPASGSTLSITGILAARADIEGIREAFSHAGYPLAGIALPPFALRNLVVPRSSETPKAPVMICQMGLHATSVSVLVDRRLVFTRSFPVGLRSLADTLVQELDPAPSHVQAGNLILELGREQQETPADGPWRLEDAFQALRPGLDRMVRQIERTLQYYQSNYNTDAIETVFLGGEIAARGRLAEFISGQLTANVIVLDPFDTPQLQEDTPLPAARAERIAYGPAFGLALSESEGSPNLARTYNDRQKERKGRRLSTAVSVFLIFLTALVGIYYNWQQTQLRALKAQLDDLDQSLQASGPRVTEPVILAAMADVQALQERRRAAAKRYEGLALLSEVTKVTPEHISLLSISADMGSPIKAAAGTARALLLEGVVDGERTSLETSLTIYVARLDQSPLFHAVEVESTKLVGTADAMRLAFTLKVETGNDKQEAIAKR